MFQMADRPDPRVGDWIITGKIWQGSPFGTDTILPNTYMGPVHDFRVTKDWVDVLVPVPVRAGDWFELVWLTVNEPRGDDHLSGAPTHTGPIR